MKIILSLTKITMSEEIQRSMLLLGLNENEKLDMRELRRAFKRKSISMLPEKHPTVPNAHSKFEEIITAFVQVTSPNRQGLEKHILIQVIFFARKALPLRRLT